jgi:hypothetical protein
VIRRLEERYAQHLLLVLIAVCLIAIPITFWVNHHDVGTVNNRVTNIESPCIRYGAKSKLCREAFEQAVLTITHPEACAILRKAGLEIVDCAHARLKQEETRRREREGVVPLKPSHSAPQLSGPPSSGPSGGSQPPVVSENANNPPHPASHSPSVTDALEEVTQGVKEAVCEVIALGVRVCIH